MIEDSLARRIGESATVRGTDVVEAGSIRRFSQAIMDDDPNYYDPEAPVAAAVGGIIAPPLYPTHCLRPEPSAPDPLDAVGTDPDYDGVGDVLIKYGLPPLESTPPRLLNGGNRVELYEYARVGDTIAADTTIAQIFEKQGSSGPLLFVITETVYRAENRDAVLLKSTQTNIYR